MDHLLLSRFDFLLRLLLVHIGFEVLQLSDNWLIELFPGTKIVFECVFVCTWYQYLSCEPITSQDKTDVNTWCKQTCIQKHTTMLYDVNPTLDLKFISTSQSWEFGVMFSWSIMKYYKLSLTKKIGFFKQKGFWSETWSGHFLVRYWRTCVKFWHVWPFQLFDVMAILF